MGDSFSTPDSGGVESVMDLIDFSNESIDTTVNPPIMPNTNNTTHGNALLVNTSYLDDLQDIIITTTEDDRGNMSSAEGAENSSTMCSSANPEKSEVSDSSFEIPEDWQEDSYPVISYKHENHDPSDSSAPSISLNGDQTERIPTPIRNDLYKLTELEPYHVSHEDCVKSYDTLSDDLGLIQVKEDFYSKTIGELRESIKALYLFI